MKIGIIGAGISGLVTAHLLHGEHDVTVLEANDYVGGHTNTVDVDEGDADAAFADADVMVEGTFRLPKVYHAQMGGYFLETCEDVTASGNVTRAGARVPVTISAHPMVVDGVKLVLVTFIEQLRAEGMAIGEAVRTACRLRFRKYSSG